MSGSPKSKRSPTPRSGSRRNGAGDDDRTETLEAAPNARAAAAVRWREGRPLLSMVDRQDRSEDRIDALIADTREHGAQLAQLAREQREGFDRLGGATLRMTAELSDLRAAIGPEPNARASIADMSPEDVHALASQGLRPAVHAMLAVHAAERAEDLARATATAAKLARVERGQSRSTSLLAVLLLTVTALQESGALRGLLRALFGG